MILLSSPFMRYSVLPGDLIPILISTAAVSCFNSVNIINIIYAKLFVVRVSSKGDVLNQVFWENPVAAVVLHIGPIRNQGKK